jgi:hypothetical protein
LMAPRHLQFALAILGLLLGAAVSLPIARAHPGLLPGLAVVVCMVGGAQLGALVGAKFGRRS